MCGICGVHQHSGTIDESDLKRMTDTMAYRGPDREGFVVHGPVGLGYRRLSIIDLETGDQPIANEDETIWVVHNGELYNYLDLRVSLQSSGHRFRTQSDTEILVHGYEEWGVGLLGKLNGMFAFALWDGPHRRLLLARDRLGVKPLYYQQGRDRLTFASEIKCLLLDGLPPFEPEAIVDYLSFLNCYGSKTFFSGIRKLLPGHYMIAGDHGIEEHEYWDAVSSRPAIADEDAAVDQYLRLLEDAVALELMSDVPLGAQLSGGMDSSAVVVAAHKKMAGFDTFSARVLDPRFDETPFARRVAEIVGGRYNEVLVKPSVVPDLMPRILHHLDEPRAGPGVIPQFLVCELASKRVRVLLTGHGGDELFAGYPSYYAAYLRDAVRRGGKGDEILKSARNLLPRLRNEGAKRILGLPIYALASEDLRRYGREAVFSLAAIHELVVPSTFEGAKGYDPRTWLDRYLQRCPATDALSRLQYLDIKTYLPSLLDNEDRASMAYSVEARVPILDHRLAEFAVALAPNLRVQGLTLKYLPRRALAGYLPKEIVEHRKMGFPVPISDWFREDLAPWVDRVLAEDRVHETGILRPRIVRALVDAHLSGKGDLGDQLWAIVNLELFVRGHRGVAA